MTKNGFLPGLWQERKSDKIASGKLVVNDKEISFDNYTGPNQIHKNDKTDSEKLVGEGIYCTPLIEYAEDYAK